MKKYILGLGLVAIMFVGVAHPAKAQTTDQEALIAQLKQQIQLLQLQIQLILLQRDVNTGYNTGYAEVPLPPPITVDKYFNSPTISIDRSVIQSGETVNLKLGKYPTTVTQWRFSYWCTTDSGVTIVDEVGNSLLCQQFQRKSFYIDNVLGYQIKPETITNTSNQTQTVTYSLEALNSSGSTVGNTALVNITVYPETSTSPGPTSPTIGTNRSVIQSGESAILAIGKYPLTASNWRLNTHCPEGVSVNQKGGGCASGANDEVIFESSGYIDWPVSITNTSNSNRIVGFNLVAQDSNSNIIGNRVTTNITVYPGTSTSNSPVVDFVESPAEDRNVLHPGERATVYGSGFLGNSGWLTLNISCCKPQTIQVYASRDSSFDFIVPQLPDGRHDLFVVTNTSLQQSNTISVQIVNTPTSDGSFTSSPLTSDERTTSYDYPNDSCSKYRNYTSVGSVRASSGPVYNSASQSCGSGSVADTTSFRAYSCMTPSTGTTRVTYAFKCRSSTTSSVNLNSNTASIISGLMNALQQLSKTLGN